MKKSTIITIAIVVLLALLCVGKYNGIVSKEENVDNKWAQVDNQLKRRADLIPNLVNTVKGYATHEKEAIDSVTKARAQLAGAKTPEDAAEANGELSGALSRLLVVAENYPNLKADKNFQNLMDSLEGTENRIAVARKDYNDGVTDFNQTIRKFPGNIIAGVAGAEKKKYFEVTEKEKEAPKVDFGGSN